MDRLFIDNKEVEMGGEVRIYLTYRSNIMNPDISKILGNNSSTIKVPHTLHNASIIENAQMVTSDTRFPYIKHTADVVRDGITLIHKATAILLKTTPEEYELSLVWGASEELRQMATENVKLPSLASHLNISDKRWEYQPSGSAHFPEAIYGFVRRQDNGKYWYHPVVSLEAIIKAIEEKYSASFKFSHEIGRKLSELVIPVLRSATPKQTIRFIKYQGNNNSGAHIDWDYIDDTKYKQGDLFVMDDVKLSHMDVHIIASGYTTTVVAETQRLILDAYYISVTKKVTTTSDDGETQVDYTEIAEIPCTKITPQQGISSSYFDIEFKADITEDIDTFNNLDEIYFNFAQRPVPGSPNDKWVPFVITWYESAQANLVFNQDQITLGEMYYIGNNMPEIEIIKFLKGIMQMLGIFAYMDSEGSISMLDYPTFFARKAEAQDWSGYLCMTATDASEEQEYEPEGFYQKNLVQYKDDDANKGMDGAFTIDNETLETEGKYITLPFTSVATIDDYERPGIAKIPMYKQVNEDEDEWNPTTEREDDAVKNVYVLRNRYSSSGYYLSREGLDWDTLLATSYQGIIQSVQQAHYITATFYMDAVTLQGIDMGTPVYLQQYASYFAIIEIKTKKNNLAEVKLLKLV
jgi:hypothetical protein